ncbi:hypothetical protein [Methylobacterium soli]|uniref:Uncharacterized protein n=1 Tax=Methylobacterium soli TaxID=553447 RepID=A0A6L3SRN9_9HYPH|nr:hypothetical protein [Methylobacterium soli]KAB1068539.1 hypothetical protein F6X53_31605 [Methylobacterium soli]GJE43136.1 hypothetical protein AEGHOMDF_2315 [Methylobacterium soli]
MAPFEQTFQTFKELLANDRAASVGAVDEAVWAYPGFVQSLDAQTEALDELSETLARLNASSPFLPMLMDTIDRHRQRLAGPSS